MRAGVAGLALLASLGVAGPASAEPCAEAAVADLPLSRGTGGAAMVTASIDGAAEPLIVDTGAEMSVIREGVAETLGLQRRQIPLDAAFGVGGRPFEDAALARVFELGALRVGGMAFLVEPRTHATASGAAGLLGADLLRHYDVDLDFPARRLRLFRPGACPPSSLFPRGGFDTLRFGAADGGRMLVPAQLNGHDAQALIDSGAALSLVTIDAAHRLFGANPSAAEPVGSVIAADGGTLPVYAYPFERLRLGTLDIVGPRIFLVPNEMRRLHRVGETAQLLPDLTIGIDLLRRLHLVIDYAGATLYLATAP